MGVVIHATRAMGVVIHATRLMQPGEFALWGDGKLVAAGLLGSRLQTAFDAVALHVDDSAVLCARLGDGSRDPGSVLGAIAGWWEYEMPRGEVGLADRERLAQTR